MERVDRLGGIIWEIGDRLGGIGGESRQTGWYTWRVC